MTEELSFKPVSSLRQALTVRSIRNSCYQYLTNHRKPIGIIQQVRWYFRYYRNAIRISEYRVYLFHDEQETPVGYGALQLRNNQLYVTECVATEHRNQAYGKEILRALVAIGKRERRDLVAEIWANNERSLAMHTEAGFVLTEQRVHAGQPLLIFCYPV